MILKTPHTKLMIEEHEPYRKPGVNACVPIRQTVSTPCNTPLITDVKSLFVYFYCPDAQYGIFSYVYLYIMEDICMTASFH